MSLGLSSFLELHLPSPILTTTVNSESSEVLPIPLMCSALSHLWDMQLKTPLLPPTLLHCAESYSPPDYLLEIAPSRAHPELFKNNSNPTKCALITHSGFKGRPSHMMLLACLLTRLSPSRVQFSPCRTLFTIVSLVTVPGAP